MKKAWTLTDEKAIINFSISYCNTDEEVLSSSAFRSLLEKFFTKYSDKHSRNNKVLVKSLNSLSPEDKANEIIKLFKLLTIHNSKNLSEEFPKYKALYEYKADFRHLVEEIYTYWRKLERYSVIFDNKSTEGLISSNFIEVKEDFDKLILNLYRKVSNNISMEKPNVYRQITAGTNVGMVMIEPVWAIPAGYENLARIPFVRELVMEAPLITYPKRNKRTGFFKEVYENPITNSSINTDQFFCYPAKVGNLLAFTFVHRDFMTHMVSLANLFEMADESEYIGRKPDMIYLMGGKEIDGSAKDIFYMDKTNDIAVGYVTNNENYDYFGYMKKMLLTIHNVHQIESGNLPIHGAMVNIILKNGAKANVVILGDSGAGKSESIEAFRSLAEDHIADMSIIFDDMGTFSLRDGEKIKAYGTEIGAFVRLDDLEAGYAFKELDRAILMNPDKTNARLTIPVATHGEIIEGHPIDFFLYANNYTEVNDGEKSIDYFKTPEEALKTFKAGRRMAKGTTQEVGLTESYFANPFGPMQRQEETDILLDKYFKEIFDEGIQVGELKTQLAISGNEKTGPEQAAMTLFEEINKRFEKKEKKID